LIKPEYYTVKEFAKLVGLTPGGIYKQIREGRLSSVDIGGTRRISKAVLKSRLRNGSINKPK
jgi:excisionase family DNA binding protein